MIGLLLKGEKGLYYSDGTNLYFPDRTWKEARAGFFDDMSVTVEKEKFSFIKGRMIETLPLDEKIFFNETYYKFNPKYEYFRGKIEDIELIAVKTCSTDLEFYINTKDGLVLAFALGVYFASSYVRLSKEHYRRNQFFRGIVESLTPIDITEQMMQYYRDNCRIEGDRVFEALMHIASDRPMVVQNIKGIELYDDAFILVKYSYTYSSEVRVAVFVYDGYGVCDVINSLEIAKCRVTREISAEDFEKFLVDNHVSLGYGESVDKYPMLISKKFSAFGNTLKVIAFDSARFRLKYLEDENLVKMVTESFEEFNAEVKRIGKSCSTSMISELRGLNVKPWLLHKETY